MVREARPGFPLGHKLGMEWRGSKGKRPRTQVCVIVRNTLCDGVLGNSGQRGETLESNFGSRCQGFESSRAHQLESPSIDGLLTFWARIGQMEFEIWQKTS